MAFQIKEQHGIFKVIGNISSQNVNSLENYVSAHLHKTNHLILSNENVDQLDRSGAFMLERLYKVFVKKNRIISIIGNQNKKIANIMALTKTNYILSSDRI